MSSKSAARLWLWLGTASLLILWAAILFRPARTGWAGVLFTGAPFVAAAIDLWPRWRKDPWSAVAALGLFVLFCMAWMI
jgi:hypothetical protein